MRILGTIVAWIRGLFDRNVRMESRDGTAVVCVGMERSGKYGSCPGAASDSGRMRSLLSRYSSSTVLLQDGKATVSAVRNALAAACRKDLAIFFYSGHGGRVRNPKAQDGSGYSEHLCLNNGALYDHDIWSVVSQAKGRVVLIFDCCHSATMYRSSAKYNSYVFNRGFEFSMLKGLAFSQGRNNVLVWSGCPADGYSYGDGSGGVLTNAILDAYRADRTYDRVWRYAARTVSSQRPVRTVIGEGFDGPVFR